LIYKIILLLIFSTQAWSFDKDFKTVNDRVPLEFNHLFESLKLSTKTSAEKIKLIGICKDLDENLGFLGKEHIFMLMKSEVIKNVLEHKFIKVRSFDVTTFLLERLESSFKEKQKYLTPFSQWIWRSILAELNYRKSLGLLTTQSFNPAKFPDAKKSQAIRFSRYLNYLLPWIDKMDSLDTTEFNQLAKDVSWIILKRLNERSLLFKRYASSAETGTKVTIFNIPGKLLELHPEEIKRMQQDDIPLSLKEQSEQAKTEAQEQLQNLGPDDLSPISEELSKELEEKAP